MTQPVEHGVSQRGLNMQQLERSRAVEENRKVRASRPMCMSVSEERSLWKLNDASTHAQA